MTLLPIELIGTDDDWWESLRAYWWPRLEMVWPWAEITVSATSHVGYVEVDEETFETVLWDIGFVRNPVAGYKVHPDGPDSTGSWVLLPDDDPTDTLDSGQQLHVVIFPSARGLELHAHIETDWRSDPIGHLQNPQDIDGGIELTTQLIDQTYVTLNP